MGIVFLLTGTDRITCGEGCITMLLPVEGIWIPHFMQGKKNEPRLRSLLTDVRM